MSPAEPETDTQALAVRDVSRAFGATQALDHVSFTIAQGETHALLGENGSGKSTLVKILAGVYHGDDGTFDRRGEEFPAADMTPVSAEALGLRFVHQSPSTFPRMTVQENMAMGGTFPTRAGGIRWRELRRTTQRLLDRYAIAATPETLLGDLRPADQTMVTVARALSDSDEAEDLILVMDEPTAALPEHEVEVLLGSLRHCKSLGHTIIYVSHRIEEVLSLADSVTVLRDGSHVVTRPIEGLSEDELVNHIIGRSLGSVFPAGSKRRPGDRVLEVEHLCGGPLRDVSFVAERGEIVGIAGLLGSGRTELLRMIFGAYPREGGAVRISGRSLDRATPRAAIAAGVGYVPEDRHQDAAYLGLTVRENLSITHVRKYWRGVRYDHAAERRDVQQAFESFSIRAAGPSEFMSSLSGGNQQKTILARWLTLAPRLLLLDEPTQGIDIGARAETYDSIRAAVNKGMTALLVSSDYEELARMSDRVLVLGDGRIRTQLSGQSLDRDAIAQAVYVSEGAPTP
jgi:ribose transport system ATP-binding protein